LTSEISVLAYGTINSGTILTGSGDPAAGILASYNPNNLNTPDSNVHGNVSVDDYASILAASGTDGIRGSNYGTGTTTIIAEAGAVISAGRYGIGAFSYDGGNVSVTNYATVTGSTAAIAATTTATGSVSIDNFGIVTGNVVSGNATFHNELAGIWNLAGISTFAGTSLIVNDGTVNTVGTSSIASSGVLSISNAGTINVQSGALDIIAAVAGTGTFTIADGATLEFGGSVAAGEVVSFQGSHGTLILDHSLSSPFVGQIANLTGTASVHDNIDLLDLTWDGTESAHYLATTATSGVLTVEDGHGHSISFNLANYTGAGIFTTQDDGHGGTLVFDPPAPTVPSAFATLSVAANDAEESPSQSQAAASRADHFSLGEPLVSAGTHQGIDHFGDSANERGASFAANDLVESRSVILDHAQFGLPSLLGGLVQTYEHIISVPHATNAAIQGIMQMGGGAGGDTLAFKPSVAGSDFESFSEYSRAQIAPEQAANYADLHAIMRSISGTADALADHQHGSNPTVTVSPSLTHADNFVFYHI
jgi:hypothetical protein